MTLPWSEDIVLGTTAPPLSFPRFHLSPRDQSYHATIWGRTGSGKSKLLQSVFLQHLSKGHGVGLIEPLHNLSFETICYLVAKGFFRKQENFDRLVYIDWGNGWFVPFNVLAGEGDPEDLALNAYSGMLRVWPELDEAPLFRRLFLSSVVALISNGLPLTMIYRFLAEPAFRKACMVKVTNPLVQQAIASYEALGRDQMQAAGSTLNRAFALSFASASLMTLGQPDNWLPFRKWIDEGTCFIINLGNIKDPETRKLIGAMLMVQIEQAALSRVDTPSSERKPYTVLVDEWPSFAAQDKTIGTILSQSRQFKLTLYLAAQSLSQVSSERLTGALENCRLTVAFGLGRDSAEIQAKHVGQADPLLIKEQPLTLTQHSQYFSILEQFESWTQELQNLSPQMAYVKLHDKPAAKIKTLNVGEPKVDLTELEEVLDTYKRRYQRRRQEAEAEMAGVLTPRGHPSVDGTEGHSPMFFSGPDGRDKRLPN